jgi:dolichol-phosphate mannosyltransferase
MEAVAQRKLLSVVIPAHYEAENLRPTVQKLLEALDAEGLPFEIIVVNDGGDPGTQAVAEQLRAERAEVRVVPGARISGFGRAVRAGLAQVKGEVVVITMADRSDSPHDVVRYYQKIEEGFDCVFGSRFRKESRVSNYPVVKLLTNRLVNKVIQLLFWTPFNDLTNAFKAYRREVIVECGPYSSSHFNLTIEMSLSALIRHYHIAEIPIDWTGRTWGGSHLRIGEMGRRYLSVLLKLFFEKMLIADDLLEERLAQRRDLQDRYEDLEARVSTLEDALQADASTGSSAHLVAASRSRAGADGE